MNVEAFTYAVVTVGLFASGMLFVTMTFSLLTNAHTSFQALQKRHRNEFREIQNRLSKESEDEQ